MKQAFVLCIILLIFVLTGCRELPPITSEEQSLTVDENSLDVVISPEASNAFFKFLLRNKTDECVRLTKVVPSCECVSIEKFPNELAPNSSAELLASVAFGDKFGTIKQKIIIVDDIGKVLLLNLSAYRPLKLGADPEFIQGSLAEVSSRSILFVPAIGVDVESSVVSFNDKLVPSAVLNRGGVLEVSLTLIDLSSFRSANFLKITCTLSDGSVCKRAVPIYISDPAVDTISR